MGVELMVTKPYNNQPTGWIRSICLWKAGRQFCNIEFKMLACHSCSHHNPIPFDCHFYVSPVQSAIKWDELRNKEQETSNGFTFRALSQWPGSEGAVVVLVNSCLDYSSKRFGWITTKVWQEPKSEQKDSETFKWKKSWDQNPHQHQNSEMIEDEGIFVCNSFW